MAHAAWNVPARDSGGDRGNSFATATEEQALKQPPLLHFRAKDQQRRIKNLGKSEWWLGNTFLLTSSEIPIGSLISKIHVTNFEIFKITYFLGVCVSCLLSDETGEGQPETVQKNLSI